MPGPGPVLWARSSDQPVGVVVVVVVAQWWWLSGGAWGTSGPAESLHGDWAAWDLKMIVSLAMIIGGKC